MRLSLGTVQLGVAYGVNNSVGALSDEQVEAGRDTIKMAPPLCISKRDLVRGLGILRSLV